MKTVVSGMEGEVLGARFSADQKAQTRSAVLRRSAITKETGNEYSGLGSQSAKAASRRAGEENLRGKKN